MARSRKKQGGNDAGWRRSPIVGAAAVLVIVFSLWKMSCNSGPGDSPKYDFVCSRSECAYGARMKIDLGERLPRACPKCGQKTLYNAMKCRSCSKVSPLLPPRRDFTCTSCNHHEEVRLDPLDAPHPCPKCGQKTFCKTFECPKCGAFGGKRLDPAELGEGAQFMRGGPGDAAKCPKCGQVTMDEMGLGQPVTCLFCDSTDLETVTPVEVMKEEMGLKLKPAEKRVVDEWRKGQ